MSHKALLLLHPLPLYLALWTIGLLFIFNRCVFVCVCVYVCVCGYAYAFVSMFNFLHEFLHIHFYVFSFFYLSGAVGRQPSGYTASYLSKLYKHLYIYTNCITLVFLLDLWNKSWIWNLNLILFKYQSSYRSSTSLSLEVGRCHLNPGDLFFRIEQIQVNTFIYVYIVCGKNSHKTSIDAEILTKYLSSFHGTHSIHVISMITLRQICIHYIFWMMNNPQNIQIQWQDCLHKIKSSISISICLKELD